MNQYLFKRIFKESHEPTSQLDKDTHKALMVYTAARTAPEIKAAYDKLYALVLQRPRRSIMNTPYENGIIPLEYAVMFGKTHAIDFLIRNGADVNISIYKMLRNDQRRLRKDASGKFMLTEEYAIPLKFAVELSRLEFDHISPSAAKKLKISEQERIRRNIEYRENNEPLRLLLNAPTIQVNKKDHLGKTALHYAAEYNFPSLLTPHIGFPSRIRLLLEHGADPTILDNQHNPAIQYATDPEVRVILQEEMDRRQGASASASASRGGKRKTHRRKHHRRRTHRK
jgi:hypothetical protein